MTITETTTTTATAVSLEVPAGPLARILANAKLFTGGDAARPTLQRVRIDIADGTLTVEATDSYALFRERLEVNHDAPPVTFYLERADIDGIVRGLKAYAKGPNAHYMPAGVTFAAGDRMMTVTAGGFSLTATGDPDTYWPNTSSLWPTADPEGTELVGIGCAQLARLSKVVKEDHDKATTAARFAFYGPLKPMKVTIGAGIDILVMPVRF